MIKIENIEFFGLNYEVSNGYISINILVDPQEFDLKQYRKTPFVSIIVKNDKYANEFMKNTPKEKVRNKLINFIYRYVNSHKIYEYNMYLDDEYDEIKKNFPNRLFHSILLYVESDDPLDTVDTLRGSGFLESPYLITAKPITGILTPIRKSVHYQIYNGCFINCKPFSFGDSIYNKLTCCFVKIKSLFEMTEFIKTDDENIGQMIIHRYVLRSFKDEHFWINHNKEIIKIPYVGRDDLFDKPSKNLFYLSDVPKDVRVKCNSLSIEI